MFLKNKNIIFKIRRSKVTDYAALIKSSYNYAKYFFICFENLFLKNIISTATISLVVSSADNLYKQFGLTPGPKCVIWMQTALCPGSILEIYL